MNKIYSYHLISAILIATLSVIESCNRKIDEDCIDIIDLSTIQLDLYGELQTEDSTERMSSIIESIYKPHAKMWNGYVNGLDGFVLTSEYYGFRYLDSLKIKSEKLSTFSKDNLEGELQKVSLEMFDLTGHKPVGKWYLLWGPGLTNLGSIGDGVMLIDLTHPANNSLKNIKNWFPHELNHQIYDAINPNKDRKAILNRCVNEGFASYVNEIYWNEVIGDEVYTISNTLAYTDADLRIIEENKEWILTQFQKDIYSEDSNTSSQYFSRNKSLKEDLPGAIGYWIGYKIVQSYVLEYGIESWRDIYSIDPYDLYVKSKFVENLNSL